MSTFGMANIPDNRSLMATVGSRIRADARMLAATATFWRLLGFGSFLLLTGIGVGIGSFGYSYITDQRATMDKLTTAITDALNKVTLKTDGTVKLTDGTVKLDTKGASVRLDTSGLPRPNAQQLNPTAQPQSQAKVVTDYTTMLPKSARRSVTEASATAICCVMVVRLACACCSSSWACTASNRRGRNMISPSCDIDLTVTPDAQITPISASVLTKPEAWARAEIASGTRQNSITA
jgi:hypothetical protein